MAAAALGEHLTAALVAGLALTVAGAGVLASSPGVSALRHAEAGEHDTGSGRQAAELEVR